MLGELSSFLDQKLLEILTGWIFIIDGIQTYSCCKSAVNPNHLGNKSTTCYKTINDNNIQLCSLAIYNIVLMIKSKLGPYPYPSSAAYSPPLLKHTKKCAIQFNILGCKHKRFVCAGLYNILYQSVVAVMILYAVMCWKQHQD